MASISTSGFKSGLKVLIDGDPCSIVENEFVKPGKGQAFSRVKVKNLKTGRVVDKTYKSGDSLEAADVIDLDMDFLYADGADANAVGDVLKWLKEQETYIVTLFNGAPLVVTPPNHIELQVQQTDPGIKGDTAQGGSKPATLSTGAVVSVPLFIEEGEMLRVDTRSGDYVSRAGKK